VEASNYALDAPERPAQTLSGYALGNLLHFDQVPQARHVSHSKRQHSAHWW
jgi:hypothetical protein